MRAVPAKFDCDLRDMGYVQVARFTHYDRVLHALKRGGDKQYVVAHCSRGVWSAYPATLKRAHNNACVFQYDNSGEGPLLSSDASVCLMDQTPRRILTPQSAMYVLYACL